MQYFVTGGTGLIGRHVVRELLQTGHEVKALRRPGSILPAGTEGANWIEEGIDKVTLNQLEKTDVLIHLAASGVNPSNQSSCFKVNVIQSKVLIETAVEAEVGHLVVAGSCFEYGKSAENLDKVPVTAPLLPVGLYSASKAAASAMTIGIALQQEIPLTLVRPFHVYGEGEGEHRFWPSLRKAALAGKDFKMSEGAQIRDFTAVQEVALEILNLAATPPAGINLQNLGSGTPTSLLAFGQKLWRDFGATGALLPGTVPYREGEVMRFVPDLTPYHLPFGASH